MYSLDVNFLKDRGAQSQESAARTRRAASGPADWRPAILGAVVGALFPLLALGGLLFANREAQRLQADKAEVDQQLAALQAEIAALEQLNLETQAVEADTAALVSVFDQIKPWSAILQDVSNRVPTTVRLQSLQREAGAEEAEGDVLLLSGNAESYEDVNDFVLTLGDSLFIDAEKVTLQEATLADDPTRVEVNTSGENAPEVRVEPAQVVNYTISAPFDQWTYQGEEGDPTLEALANLGAEGLVARIQELKEQGVID